MKTPAKRAPATNTKPIRRKRRKRAPKLIKPPVVRVRILVAVDTEGHWIAGATDFDPNPKDWLLLDSLGDSFSYCWVLADVPVPVEPVIRGKAVADVES